MGHNGIAFKSDACGTHFSPKWLISLTVRIWTGPLVLSLPGWGVAANLAFDSIQIRVEDRFNRTGIFWGYVTGSWMLSFKITVRFYWVRTSFARGWPHSIDAQIRKIDPTQTFRSGNYYVGDVGARYVGRLQRGVFDLIRGRPLLQNTRDWLSVIVR